MAMHGDETDLLDVARAYMGLGEHERAVEYLKNAIRYAEDDKQRKAAGKWDTYEFAGKVVATTKLDSFDTVYPQIFQNLIQSLILLGRREEARAAYHEMEKRVDNPGLLLDVRLTVAAANSLADENDRVQMAYQRMEGELSQKETELGRCLRDMKGWYEKLLALQSLDSDAEVSDEEWEAGLGKRMDEVIAELSSSCIKSHGADFYKHMSRVGQRFPSLDKKAKQFLASAEQMYAVLKDNEIIDFAPVMVEYCKVFELALWQYLDASLEYYGECAEVMSKKLPKTLGTAVRIVQDAVGKPLYVYCNELKEIRYFRNESAHINMKRIPDVERIRELIWQTGLLSDMLPAKKQQP